MEKKMEVKQCLASAQKIIKNTKDLINESELASIIKYSKKDKIKNEMKLRSRSAFVRQEAEDSELPYNIDH